MPAWRESVAGFGEPYVTTRSASERTEANLDEGGGLGLGLFIAKTLIERSGAEITLTNAAPPATGAIARIVWPRHAFEQGAAISPQGDSLQSLKDEGKNSHMEFGPS